MATITKPIATDETLESGLASIKNSIATEDITLAAGLSAIKTAIDNTRGTTLM